MSRPLLLLAVLVLGLVATPHAHADDEAPDTPTPIETPEQLLEVMEAGDKKQDLATVKRAFERFLPIYKAAERKHRRKLMKRMGPFIDSDLKGVGPAALKLIVDTKDSEIAWKEVLRKRMPQVKAKEIKHWDFEILKALYVLAPDDAIEPLLTLMKKAKQPEHTAGALRVLGAYELSKRRVYVLDELLSIVMANLPGKGDSRNPRFVAILSQLEASLNDLTGQRYNLKAWGKAWMENKKHLGRLFLYPLPKKNKSAR